MAEVYSTPPEGWLQLAKLGKTFGLKGGLYCYPLGTAESDALASLAEQGMQVFVTGLGTRAITHIQARAKGYVVFLQGVQHINLARPLVHSQLYAAPEALDALPVSAEAGIYSDALLDMPVRVDGQPFGSVLEILEAGQQDILVIAGQGGERYMVPLQADYVTLEEAGIMIDNPPEGLLES